MKNAGKRLVVGLLVMFALVGIGGTVAFASGYLTWGGTPDFETTKITLDEISQRGIALQSQRDKALKSQLSAEEQVTQLQAGQANLVNHVETVMNNVETKRGASKYEELAKGVNTLAELLGSDVRLDLKLGNTQTDDLLRQAEKDMEALRIKSQEVLDKLNEDSE